MNSLVIINVQNDMFQEGNEVFNGDTVIKTIKNLINRTGQKVHQYFYVAYCSSWRTIGIRNRRPGIKSKPQ